jgi:protein-disulfide isomerase
MAPRAPGRTGRAAIMLGAALLAATAAGTRADTLTTDQFSELQQQNKAILEELRQIHLLLERQQPTGTAAEGTRPADSKVRLSLRNDELAIGSPNAPLTLVEFTDYQCPFCRRFHETTFADIKRNYVDTGKLRFISRDFPLDMHNNAMRASLAAHCAGDQGKFWELRDLMIANGNRLDQPSIDLYAKQLKLDSDRLDKCIASGTYQARVDQDLAEGKAAGINGTPSFLLGRTGKDSIEGTKLVGAMPSVAFDTKIKELLATPRE